MQNSLLEIDSLSIKFTNREKIAQSAVKNLSLSLNHQETFAIVGESGSGKSVTALSILGLLPENAKISANKMSFHGNDLLANHGDLQKQLRGKSIAMIFQEPMTSLNPLMPIGRQVVEPMLLHKFASKKDAWERARYLLNRVGIPDVDKSMKKYPFELSGGQQQRVMIAMALTCNPELLIADEPTTALDVTVQRQVLELIKDLQNEFKMAMLFITHDLGIVADIADRVAVMYNGQVEEFGDTNSIFASPKSAYTKGLIACRPPKTFKPQRLATLEDFRNGTIIPIMERQTEFADAEIVLEAKNLVKSYSKNNYLPFVEKNEFLALNDVSMHIKKGEILGVVGESGSGKTTLARILNRLDSPSSGKVFFQGLDITKMTAQEMYPIRRKMQYIFQNPYAAMNPKMRVRDIMLEPMTIHGLETDEKSRLEKAKFLLKQVGLEPDYINRYPHEFSGGQRQRICIARALSLDPELLICDESVSALDVSVQAQILNLLSDLKDQHNLTYIFISHDLNVVRYFSDRVIVMQQGKIVESGLADDIYFRPKSEFAKSLVGAIPSNFPEGTDTILNQIYQ